MYRKILVFVFLVYSTIASYCQSKAHSQRYGVEVLNYINQLNSNNEVFINNEYSENKTTYRLDSIIEFNYNDTNDLWDINFRKDIYCYDSNNQDTLFEYFAWNTTQNSWDSLYREINTYDDEGRLSSYSAFDFHYIHGFMPRVREDYAYNNDLLKEMTRLYWEYEKADWKPSTTTQYAYNSMDFLLNDTTYLLGDSAEVSRVLMNKQYFYTDGMLDSLTKSNWLPDDQRWNNQQKTIYKYQDISGLLQERQFYLWHKEDSVWNHREETDYFYDEQERRTGRHIKEYAVEFWQNEQELREAYTLDETSSATKIILPFIYNIYIHEYSGHVILSKDLFIKKEDDETERKYREVKYYYTLSDDGSTTGIKQAKQNKMTAFPNPTKDYINFLLPNNQTEGILSFYSLHGQLIFVKYIQNNVPVDLQSLEKGAYLYRLQSGGYTYSGRIIRN